MSTDTPSPVPTWAGSWVLSTPTGEPLLSVLVEAEVLGQLVFFRDPDWLDIPRHRPPNGNPSRDTLERVEDHTWLGPDVPPVDGTSWQWLVVEGKGAWRCIRTIADIEEDIAQAAAAKSLAHLRMQGLRAERLEATQCFPAEDLTPRERLREILARNAEEIAELPQWARDAISTESIFSVPPESES